MNKQIFGLAFLLSLLAVSSAFSATVPAGATLVVRTIDTVSSQDRVGRTFKAELAQNVVVKGKTLLQSGTPAAGKIESSRANPHTTGPLTLNLTNLSVNGKTVAVQTTHPFQPKNKARTARRARQNLSVGPSTLPAGTTMTFQLAQPLEL